MHAFHKVSQHIYLHLVYSARRFLLVSQSFRKHSRKRLRSIYLQLHETCSNEDNSSTAVVFISHAHPQTYTGPGWI